MPSNSYSALNIISNQSKYNGVITMEHQDILLDKISHKKVETVNDVLAKDTGIALYSSSNALELFFLCKVLDFGVANEDLFDSYNHVITKRCKYIRC